MKKTVLIAILSILLLSLGATELIDRIVAKVGSDIILMSDIQKRMMNMHAVGMPKENINPTAVLQDMIEHQLILQKAKELDIKLNEEKLRQYAESYLKQIKGKFPSEEAFKKELKDSHLTENELFDYYMEMLREQALTDQLVERFVYSKAVVSEAEMRQFYTEHKDTLAVKPVTWKTGMIMREIQPSDAAVQARRNEINEIHNRVMNGEDFAALARETSDCPSKARGGDLGFFGPGMMVKEFEKAAFNLNVGEVSDVIRTEYGFHIIKMEEKKGNEVRARHILKIVQPTQQDSLDAKALMENIRWQMLTGNQLEDLARQYSQDTESVKNNGVIGEFDAEGMPELFRAAIMATPVGQPSPVLENEGYLFIFERIQELPQRLYSYDEVKDEIGALLSQQKQAEAYDEWIQELTKESWVQILN